MQHLGEVGGVDAAGLGADRHQRLARVVLAGEQGAHLELAERLADGDQLASRPRPACRRRPRRSASSTSTSRSSMRDAHLLDPVELGLQVRQRLVTFCARSGSSHRSGAAACSRQLGDRGPQRREVADLQDRLERLAQGADLGGEVDGSHVGPIYAPGAGPHPGRRSWGGPAPRRDRGDDPLGHGSGASPAAAWARSRRPGGWRGRSRCAAGGRRGRGPWPGALLGHGRASAQGGLGRGVGGHPRGRLLGDDGGDDDGEGARCPAARRGRRPRAAAGAARGRRQEQLVDGSSSASSAGPKATTPAACTSPARRPCS